ncbi:hypothetical protein D3C73_1361390 [compost metagenome]
MQQDLPFTGPHAAGGTDFVLLHRHDAGQRVQHHDEEGGVHDQRDFGLLTDSEPHQEQSDEGNRRNEADKIQKRLGKNPDNIHFTDNQADRDRQQAAQHPAHQHPVKTDADILHQRTVAD